MAKRVKDQVIETPPTQEETDLQNEPAENRVEILKETADAVEEIDYYKEFTDSELNSLREELGNVMVKLERLDEERKDAVDAFKDQITPLKNEAKNITRYLRDGKKIVRDTCFKFIDTEKRRVRYFDQEGIKVLERDARPTELQMTIFSVERVEN